MEKGTIIYFGAFEMPDKNAAAHRVSSIGKIFDSLGFHTVFLGRAPENEQFSGVRKSSFSDDVYEICAPVSTKEWVKYMFDTSAIFDVCKNYDNVRMIIMYSAPFSTFLAAKKKFSGTNIHIIYDCAEWADVTVGLALKRYYKRFDDMLIRKCLSKKADGIICISNMMKNAYKDNPNLLKLPPMVDINDEIWNQEKCSHGDKFEFCFAGEIDRSKDCVDKMIRAFSSIESEKATLRIVGMTEEDFRSAFSDFPINTEDSRISFMGRLSHFDAVKYVLSCDCYIFIRESTRKNNAGFPTKFVEAFTCSIPILATDISDIKEYIDNSSKGILLSSTSEEKIKEAMEQMIEEEKKNTSDVPNKTFHYENYIEITDSWLSGF